MTSIALASQKAGSQVILCTDGLANIGLGSLDGLSEEKDEAVEKWCVVCVRNTSANQRNIR